MEFRKEMLNDYLNTSEGRRVLGFFNKFGEHFKNRFGDRNFFRFVNRNLDVGCAEDYFDVIDRRFGQVVQGRCRSIDDLSAKAKSMFAKFADEDPREIQYSMPLLSCELYSKSPNFAFPYLFPVHFYRFRQICEFLGIVLPKLPRRNDHMGRCNYIFELMRVMFDFRKEYSLSPEELCTLVYGYASRFIVTYLRDEIPAANRVCMVGATPDDAESRMLKSPRDADVTYWQGNSEMTPGDIVLVYETTINKRISTIWRAVSPGFDDPFHYYSGKVFVGHPIKIPAISFKELRSDPVWKNNPKVKSCMIGVCGQSCTVEEYDALKRMIRRKDPKFQIDRLPTPPKCSQFYHQNLKVERDVERFRLEPLLRKLGFSDRDWKRQLPLRVGRGERVFPDYAVRVSGSKHNYEAKYVWEAKYRIPSSRQLEVDLGQAKSYGLMLRSEVIGLVSIEGVWVSKASDGFRFSRLLHYTWDDLSKSQVLSRLRTLFQKS